MRPDCLSFLDGKTIGKAHKDRVERRPFSKLLHLRIIQNLLLIFAMLGTALRLPIEAGREKTPGKHFLPKSHLAPTCSHTAFFCEQSQDPGPWESSLRCRPIRNCCHRDEGICAAKKQVAVPLQPVDDRVYPEESHITERVSGCEDSQPQRRRPV